MIFQFKVQMLQMEKPIWRRLLVDRDSTFYQLHEILQVAFDWGGYHLHNFMITRKDGKKVENEIGNPEEEFDFSWRVVLDEHHEKLSDWFIMEKDRAVYTYDFGDDWRHEIVLEKILSPSKDVTYPYCLKAVRPAPAEDSRSLYITGEAEIEEADSKVLTEEVNFMFCEIVNSKQDETINWNELLEKAKEFNKAKPWEWFDDDEVFVVIDPMTGENLICSILGALGEEYGMAVYIGNEGFQSLLKTTEGHFNYFDILVTQRNLLVSFSNRDELEREDYQIIKDAGLTFRGKKQWPMFRSFMPGMYPWLINEKEARLLMVAMEQALLLLREVEEENLFIPFFQEGKHIIARIPEQSEWKTELLLLEDLDIGTAPAEDLPLLVSELDVLRVSKYKRFNNPIEIDFSRIDMPIQEESGGRPYFPMMAVAIDQQSGLIIFQELVQGKNPEADAQSILLKMFHQIEKIPREIWMTKETRVLLNSLLIRLQSNVIEVEILPQIEEFKQFIGEMPKF
ncbi:plasmid pRiA4b ORF-3 family protein [Lederbergia panacisoli]|uniref:plasmid pRiA4b ORF-3 family protein n=1 Tax=Lederbergia panacisoli TaxID=1255251 RepID=UPI00214B4334|nr:plasmid pRiA4b ORF-3 family protein [Lederbergia panacisoli]MCR2822375.1 plasmid pRiA4b ORF-3 family protein [Lederbergia panacisoli]